jgi:hypothetical protein
MTGDGEDHRVFPAWWRVLPAHPGTGPGRSAASYRAAFAWGIRDDEDPPPPRTAPAT